MNNITVNKIINQVSFSILSYNNSAMTNLFTKKNTITTAKALVEALLELGVDSIFGYPGAAVLSIYNELSKVQNIKHYLVRHEQAAVHAAEGYARTCGKVGLVLVTSGPGFTNTITGIANAYADSTPLVVLVGDVSNNNENNKIFQKVDIVSMIKTCSKKTYLLKAEDDIKQIMGNAFEIANTGKKGPVVIALPRNILERNYTNKNFKLVKTEKISKIREIELEKTVKLLKNAKAPLILIGGGAINSVEKIESVVNKFNIPVVSTLMGIGTFPSKDKNYLWMIGVNGTYLANTTLENSDLIIALGVSFSDRSTCKNKLFEKASKIICVNIEKFNTNFVLQIQAEVELFLQQLCEIEFNNNYHSWQEKINIYREENKSQEPISDKLHSSSVLEIVYEFTKPLEPIVVTDVGQHQMLTAQYFNFNKPKKFITSGGLGTMGFGLPASIGAQIANPSSLVMNITGDGSFQMNLQELATCREHNIPIKIIIMNNGYLGMVRQMQEKIYNNRYQVEMINPDFTKIAEAYDLFAIRVSKIEDLQPALTMATNHKGTAIVDIAIDSFEEI